MIVVAGSASRKIAHGICEVLSCDLANVEIKRFPDGEAYVRIDDDLSGEDVIVVQTTYPDENIVELFLIHDAVREFKLNSMITVAPYFGYGRQDKKFKDGEAVSARAMARHIEMDADAFITVDVHSPEALSYFSIKANNTTAMGVIGEYLTSLREMPEMVIAPDDGAIERAKIVAEKLDADWDYMEKVRIDGENVEIFPKNVDVEGKVVVVVDDIISTGGTMAKAGEILKAFGAKKVYSACTHGIFAKNALERLRNVFDVVLSTDTIERSTSLISAARPIATAIKNALG
ncbi:MAG: ribose-phosphate diphosphokinase [Thermoplasmata archaeon]|nr:MAG: ribose-phosphate diphosphokinase [Thermoplasmata archaeon]